MITPDALPIIGDRIQLQQVILNLVVNGIDAMKETPRENRMISIRTSRVENFAELSVSDRGPGIPEDKLKEVFEPFFTSKAEGMGMGLSIARTIIEAHHGLISAKNRDIGGASFRIRLPCNEPDVRRTSLEPRRYPFNRLDQRPCRERLFEIGDASGSKRSRASGCVCVPVMKITSTEMPAALRRSRNSMPEPSVRLMSDDADRVFEIGVSFEKLHRWKQHTVVPMLRNRRSRALRIAASSSTTRTRFRFGMNGIPDLPPIRSWKSIDQITSQTLT